jgi:hypothetical protein
MKVVFTIHAKEKLLANEAKRLGITRKKITESLEHPLAINKDVDPHQSVGELNHELSLAVIWKIENDIIKVITFYPAEKGRYESKILRRR